MKCTIHLDTDDVTEILGGLEMKIRSALVYFDERREAGDEPNAIWWISRARTLTNVAQRLTKQLWGPGAVWLSPDLLARLEAAEAALAPQAATELPASPSPGR